MKVHKLKMLLVPDVVAKKLSGAPLRVFIHLMGQRSGQSNVAVSTRAWIADALSLSTKTIKRAEVELERDGWIERHGRVLRDGVSLFAVTDDGRVPLDCTPEREFVMSRIYWY